MRAEKFQHEAIGTSKTFYRSQGLKVVFQGDRAKTDGDTVYLPSLPMDQDIDLHRQQVMRGFIDHEAGHGRHTDPEAWSKSGHDPKRLTYAPILFNAIEDLRVEGIVNDEYPGAQKNIEAVADSVNKHYLDKYAKTGMGSDFSKVGAIAMTWEARRRMGYQVPSNEECLKTLSPDVREKVEKMVDLAMSCKSTMDAVQLAVTIDKEIQEKQEEEKSKASGAGGGLGGSGAGKGKGGGADGAHHGNPGSHGAGGSTTDDGYDEDMKSPMIKADLSQGVNDQIAAGDHDDGHYRVWTWDKDHWMHVSDTAKKNFHKSWKGAVSAHGLEYYAKARSGIDAAVSAMRRKLERALITKQNRGWKRNQEEGLLDSKRLAMALTGESRVHRKREETEDLNVCVQLVVDLSGSMSGSKIYLAQQAAICYGEALDKVGIPFSIVGFTTDYSETLNPLETTRGATTYRNHPLSLYVFKRWDETLKKAKPAIGGMVSCSMQDNADGDSLLQIYWKSLKPRDEKRKVMVVFSDGYPASHPHSHQHQRLRDVVNHLIKDEGVELFGIGIESDAPKKFYPKWAIVNDANDLAKAALDQLAKMLIDPNFKVDNRELMKVGGAVRK